MSGLVGKNIKKYRVSARIGRGGMGTVYRALDLTLHRDVAIKVLNSELSDDEIAKRFRAEAMTVARLNHPGIARIYEFLEYEGQWMMVMEYLRGETFERLVERLGPLPAPRAADLVMQTLSALSHAHSMDVVHRDLKPSNLMLTESGEVKTMDFGIARVAGAEQLTSAGLMMGTPAYMAPEQVTGGAIDARTDVYSLGVVLFYLLTSKLPFEGTTPMSMARSRVDGDPTPVHTLRQGLPEWVAPILARAMAKAPEDRFQSADEFQEALRHGLDGRPADQHQETSLAIGPMIVSATPVRLAVPSAAPTPPTPSVPDPPAFNTPLPELVVADPEPRRSPLTKLIAGAVVLGAVAVAVAFWVNRNRPPQSNPEPLSVSDLPSATPPLIVASPEPTPATTPVGAPAAPSPGVAGRGTRATPTPGASPSPAVSSELLAFPDVKLCLVRGNKIEEEDAVLNFVAGQISVTPRKGGPALASLGIRQILRATHVHAKAPAWDASLAAPPAGVDYPGRSARHWLTLQSPSAFLVLHLSDGTWRSVLATLEERSPLKVDRRN